MFIVMAGILVDARQSLIAPSWLPVAKILPSGENAIA
jgi:hypothetical protein